jgi:hypothetical protein
MMVVVACGGLFRDIVAIPIVSVHSFSLISTEYQRKPALLHRCCGPIHKNTVSSTGKLRQWITLPMYLNNEDTTSDINDNRISTNSEIKLQENFNDLRKNHDRYNVDSIAYSQNTGQVEKQLHERLRNSEFILSNQNVNALTGASLGDIMDGTTGLVTSNMSESSPRSITTETLAQKYGITNPLDRMALTANGNLQRLVSSYYDAPVEVRVAYCHLRQDTINDGTVPKRTKNQNQNNKTWDRKVDLIVFDQVFCTATSVITVHDAHCQALVESNRVGLGQLFRYLDLLPAFCLHDAGTFGRKDSQPTDQLEENSMTPLDQNDRREGGFWRSYTLQCRELTCNIYEEFTPGLWNIR